MNAFLEGPGYNLYYPDNGTIHIRLSTEVSSNITTPPLQDEFKSFMGIKNKSLITRLV